MDIKVGLDDRLGTKITRFGLNVVHVGWGGFFTSVFERIMNSKEEPKDTRPMARFMKCT